MKIWFLRIMVWVSLRLHVYYAWSRVYQWLYEKRKWEQVAIPLFSSFTEIEKIVGAMEWQKDTWRELKDAISMPQAAYGKHLKGERTAKDCDDISIFAAHCIERAWRCVDLRKTLMDVGLLSSPWVRDGKVSGHNVCAFAYRRNGGTQWAYISNWYSGRIQWGFDCKEDIVKQMLGDTATSLGWAYARVSLQVKNGDMDHAKLKLKPIEYHWKVKGN